MCIMHTRLSEGWLLLATCRFWYPRNTRTMNEDQIPVRLKMKKKAERKKEEPLPPHSHSYEAEYSRRVRTMTSIDSHFSELAAVSVHCLKMPTSYFVCWLSLPSTQVGRLIPMIIRTYKDAQRRECKRISFVGRLHTSHYSKHKRFKAKI